MEPHDLISLYGLYVSYFSFEHEYLVVKEGINSMRLPAENETGRFLHWVLHSNYNPGQINNKIQEQQTNSLSTLIFIPYIL